jgi:hypothetical protein
MTFTGSGSGALAERRTVSPAEESSASEGAAGRPVSLRPPARRHVTFEQDGLLTEMTIEQERLARDLRRMTVILTQPAVEGCAMLAVEFSEAAGRELGVRGRFSAPGTPSLFFNRAPDPRRGDAPRSARARGWSLIHAFIEEGFSAALQMLPPEGREAAAQDCRHPSLSKRLRHAAVSLLDDPNHRTLVVAHNDAGWGDEVAFRAPCPAADEITPKMVLNFFDELCSEAPSRSDTTLEELRLYLSTEQGQVEIYRGARPLLLHGLHRKLAKRLFPRLELWQRGGSDGIQTASDILRFGLTHDLLRRRGPEFDIFSEMELAVAPRPDSPHSYFVLKNAHGLRVRFNLPPAPSLREWHRRMESIVRCFVSRPQALLQRHAEWIDAREHSSFPATPAAIKAYQHVTRLYRAEAAARKGRAGPDASSALSFKNGIFEATFTRAHHASLTFRASQIGIERVTILKPQWPLPQRGVFPFKTALPSHGRLLKLFSEFYEDRGWSSPEIPIQKSRVGLYLSGCCSNSTGSPGVTGLAGFLARAAYRAERLIPGRAGVNGYGAARCLAGVFRS